jgi:hypothetical protein
LLADATLKFTPVAAYEFQPAARWSDVGGISHSRRRIRIRRRPVCHPQEN